MSKGKAPKASIPMPTSEHQSVRIEKIANGYLSHHSTDGPKGYQTKTMFHASKPQIQLQAQPKKKGK